VQYVAIAFSSYSLTIHSVFATDSDIALNRAAGHLEGKGKQLEGNAKGVEARDFVA
jgi:hypothetical protein